MIFAVLQKLGWREGEGVGVRKGITEPIAARIPLGREGVGMKTASEEDVV